MTRTPIFATLGLSLVAALFVAGCEVADKPTLETVPPPPALQTSSQSTGPVFIDDSAGTTSADAMQSTSVEPVILEPTPIVQSTTYTVQKGDTLWKIARNHYGSGTRWVDIRDANPGLNPTKLAVGQKIVLP